MGAFEPSSEILLRRLRDGSLAPVRPAQTEAIEIEINHRGGVESQHLADDETADDGDAERPAQFGTRSSAESKRKRAEERGHGGHQDGPETENTGLKNRLFRGFMIEPLGGQCE